MKIIGDRINGTNPVVRKAIETRDVSFIENLARMQASNSHYIDVNVGTARGSNEKEAMMWAVNAVISATGKPVSIDSPDPLIIESVLNSFSTSSHLINSVNGDKESMDRLIPIAKELGCPIVALCMDSSGIPSTSKERLDICLRIIERATSAGIAIENIYFDPLVLPLACDSSNARLSLETMELIKGEISGARIILGISNISFGLPGRSIMESAFLAIAMSKGLDAALLDPTNHYLLSTIYGTDTILGNDPFARRYVKAYRSGEIQT